MSSHAFVQHLQQLYAHTQRDAAHCLPPGCTQVSLLHEDDLTTWFVQFAYNDGEEKANDTLYVSLKLCFSDEGCSLAHEPTATTTSSSVLLVRMPLIFVIAPRLQAAFIHHGALCALELLSYKLPLTREGLYVLLATLHRTLDPFATGSEVRLGVGSDRGNNNRVSVSREAYTAEEHDDGLRFIQHAHPYLFRPHTTQADTVDVSEETSSIIEHRTKVCRLAALESAVKCALLPQQGMTKDGDTASATGVELLLNLHALSNDDAVCDVTDNTMTALLRDELQERCMEEDNNPLCVCVLSLALPTDDVSDHNTSTIKSVRIAAADETLDGTRIVFAIHSESDSKANDTVSLCSSHVAYTFEGLTLYGHWNIGGNGSVRFIKCTLWGTLRVEGAARVMMQGCTVLFDPRRGGILAKVDIHTESSNKESAIVKEGIVVLDSAYMELTAGCYVQCYTASLLRHDTAQPPQNEKTETSQASLTTLVALYHTARMQLVDSVIGTSHSCGIVQYALVAEQEACVDAAYCTVHAGRRAAIRLQGAQAHLEHCHITGNVEIQSTQCDTLPCSKAVDNNSSEEGIGTSTTDLTLCVGVKAELGAQLSARHCLVTHTSVGMAIIAMSVADLDECHVMQADCGFLLNAATARLTSCGTSNIRSTGLEIHDGAKAIVTAGTPRSPRDWWWWQRCLRYMRKGNDGLRAMLQGPQRPILEALSGALGGVPNIATAITWTLEQCDELLFSLACTSDVGTIEEKEAEQCNLFAVGPRCIVASHASKLTTPITRPVRRGFCDGACNVWLSHAELHATGLTLCDARHTAVCAQAGSLVRMQDCLIFMPDDIPSDVTNLYGGCGVDAVRSTLDMTRCFCANGRCGFHVTSSTTAAAVHMTQCVAWRVLYGWHFTNVQATLRGCTALALCEALCATNKSHIQLLPLEATPALCGTPDAHISEAASTVMHVWQGMQHALLVKSGSVLQATGCHMYAGQCAVRVQDCHSHVTLSECQVRLSLSENNRNMNEACSTTVCERDGVGDALLHAAAGLRLSSHTSASLTNTHIHYNNRTHSSTDNTNSTRVVVVGVVLVGQAAQLEAQGCVVDTVNSDSTMLAEYAAMAGAEMKLTDCRTAHSAGVGCCHVGLIVCDEAKASLRGGNFAAQHTGLLCEAGTVLVQGAVRVVGWQARGLTLRREAYVECMAHSSLRVIHATCEQHGRSIDKQHHEERRECDMRNDVAGLGTSVHHTSNGSVHSGPVCIAMDHAKALLRHVTLRGVRHRPLCIGLMCAASRVHLRRCRFQTCLPCVFARDAAQVRLQRCVFYTEGHDDARSTAVVRREGSDTHVQQDACEVRHM